MPAHRGGSPSREELTQGCGGPAVIKCFCRVCLSTCQQWRGVFGGVFLSWISVAVFSVSLQATLWCPGGGGIALGGCLGEFFARIFCPSLVVVVYVCAFIFRESVSGYL